MKKHAIIPDVFALLITIGILGSTGYAATWHVRAGASGDGSAGNPFGQIQQGIDAAAAGDSVLVAEGTYLENLTITGKSTDLEGGWDAAFAERDPSLHVTTVDGNQSGRCLKITNSSGGTVSGFTFVNGKATNGGGIYCYKAPVTFTSNLLTANSADSGGGMYADDSTIVATENVISGNTANYSGGGVNLSNGSQTFTGNIIANNKADHSGGMSLYACSGSAITGNVICGNEATSSGGGAGVSGYTSQSNPMLIGNTILSNSSGSYGGAIDASEPSVVVGNLIVHNSANSGGGVYTDAKLNIAGCTIAMNSATESAGGISFGIYSSSSGASLTSSILWGNTALKDPQVSSMYPMSILYCDIQGGREGLTRPTSGDITYGPGNIDVDPMFADPAAGDFHLKSMSGRWNRAADDGAGAWVVDDTLSLCIDAGDPAADYSAESEPAGGRVNMGAFGNTAEASRSYAGPTCLLTIRSTPITGVFITGSHAGVTDFTLNAIAEAEITLIATEANGLFFLRWEDEAGTVISNQCRLVFRPSTDRTLVAVFGEVTHFYVNDSVPEDDVAAGDDDNPGTSSRFPMASIQAMLNRYWSLGEGHAIILAPGRFTENVAVSRHSGLTIRALRPGETVIDGNRAGSCLRLQSPYVSVSGLILSNGLYMYGAGLTCMGPSASVTGCTVAGNAGDGPAVYCSAPAMSMRDTIVWGNGNPGAQQISLRYGGTLILSYCDLMGGLDGISTLDNSRFSSGPGNIEADPLFADPASGDYHVKSVNGRWDPAANDGLGDWVTDSVHSSCIDAGDPSSEFADEPAPNGSRVNVGAFGNSPQASKSYVGPVRTLTVRSEPVIGISITGTLAGTTDFARDLVPGSIVLLRCQSSGNWAFDRWEDEAGAVVGNANPITIQMDADKTLVAVYRQATDFYVNDAIAEEGFWPGDNANPGTSPELPMASIGLLLNRYPDIGGGCTVHVAPGTYQENIYVGPERSGLVLVGAGPGASIIDGGQLASCLILDCPEVAVDGFTIRNGEGWGMGGGIACLSGSPVISNNHLIGNSFRWWSSQVCPGAAISCASSSPLIVQNVIADNAGGYDACGGLYCIDSPAIVTSNTFTRNSSTNYRHGGAIECAGTSTPVIMGNEITDNKAASRGASILSSGPITLGDNVISDNASSSSISLSSAVQCAAPATITDNTFIGNDSTAITCYVCEVSIVQNTISGSKTGIYATSTSGSVQDNTISANETGIDWSGTGTISGNVLSGNTGIAIDCGSYEPSLSVTQNTVTGNAGGIYCTGHVTAARNTVTQDTGAKGRAAMKCSTNVVLEDNMVMNNQYRGIECSGGTISGNTIIDNTNHGVYCTGAATIIGNTIARNGGGVYCIGSFGFPPPMITQNVILDNAGGYGGIAAIGEFSPTISGNTISGNKNTAYDGAGLYCWLANVIVRDNVISHNEPTGAAVSLDQPEGATFSGNIITANGGMGLSCEKTDSLDRLSFSSDSIIANARTGLYFCDSVAKLSNCLIADNGEHGIRAWFSSLSVENSTVAGNGSPTTPAMLCEVVSDIVVRNSIFWRPAGATASVIDIGFIWSGDGDLTISYSDIDGGKTNISWPGSHLYWSSTNISLDPLFADPANGDYHLKSRYGRWDPAANDGAGAWVNDDLTSPCIDAGDPASPYVNEPQPNSCRVNMGAYGNTAQASKSRWSIAADVNDDCIVNILDLIAVRGRLNQPVTTGDNWKADANDDGRINVLDLIFVRGKLASTCK